MLLFLTHEQNWLSLFLLLDHVLVGHVMSTAAVVDEYECQLKCIQNKSCKSFSIFPDGNNVKRQICELSNKTRQMKPGDFKWKNGYTYYGSVQVSENVYVITKVSSAA